MFLIELTHKNKNIYQIRNLKTIGLNVLTSTRLNWSSDS